MKLRCMKGTLLEASWATADIFGYKTSLKGYLSRGYSFCEWLKRESEEQIIFGF
jgi:hypothetical protein